MKISLSLAETDLARDALLPDNQKRNVLHGRKSFAPPRLQDGLGPLGRTFVFSAMHHLIAVGDFEGARLEILRFPKNRCTGQREVEVFAFDERDVVEETVLNEAIDRTFKIWVEI